jgi:hypothetical protein
MKYFLLLGTLIYTGVLAYAQNLSTNTTYLDVNYFTGTIALHNNDILHLISGHPEGFILSWNKKTYGFQQWEQRYNYPDYGASFIYQDLKNRNLGDNYGIYAHYNFYFFKRTLTLRVGQGIALTTNPYDKINNPKNIAFGSEVLSSTYLMLNYKRERLFGDLGLQAGLSLIHYSNANVKAPNTSVNSIALNLGVNYNLNKDEHEYIRTLDEKSFAEPIAFNFTFRTGINESDVIGSGQFPFYIASAYADKRISYYSAIQLGVDVFFSDFLKEFIRYRSVAFPDSGVSGDEDYKRVGMFLGHELFINKLSVVSQLGYYVYYPIEFEGRFYIRAGLKYYFWKKVFAAVTLKSHGAKAEAVEFGVGIRL